MCFNAFSHSQVNHYCELEPDSELAKIKVQSWLAEVALSCCFSKCQQNDEFNVLSFDCLMLFRYIVPSYILVGDQSSGKTSLLSRLARLPLGYTANKTGTCLRCTKKNNKLNSIFLLGAGVN